MKFIFDFSGVIGSRLFPNSISVPDLLAHQCFELMPFPMKTAAKRFGNGPVGSFEIEGAPQTGMDSSHGNAIATPAPRRNLRRESRVLKSPSVAFKSCFISLQPGSPLVDSEIAGS